jgi:hypothetical protein
VPHTAHTLEHNTPASRNKGGCTCTCNKHKGGCGCTYSKLKGGRTLKTQLATVEEGPHTSKRLGRTLYIPTQTQGGRCYTKEAGSEVSLTRNTREGCSSIHSRHKGRPQLYSRHKGRPQLHHSRHKRRAAATGGRDQR